jgi:HSP20 family protein
MYTYNVFDDMLKLRSIFDDFFTDRKYSNGDIEFPPVRVLEEEDQITLYAVIPGVKTEDLDIQMMDNSLQIRGEKKEDYENHPYIRRERFFGEFKKSIKLPYRVNSGDVKAELSNGILKITLTKSEEAKPKKIQIA